MSFESDGFLNEQILTQAADVRRDHAAWFVLARSLNGIGQRVILTPREITTERGYSDYRMYAMLFYVRAVSSFQAAITLLERGMVVEASMLVRGLIETICVIASLVEGKDNRARELAAADYAERQAAANWYLQNPSLLENVSPENIDGMKTFLDSLNDAELPLRKLNFAQMANLSGLNDLYAIYRHLSHHYAHPSVTAVMVFVAQHSDGSPRGVLWQHDYGFAHIKDSLQFACTSFIGASLAINEILPTEHAAEQLADAFNQYKALLEPSCGTTLR